jgi:hypothetical protein
MIFRIPYTGYLPRKGYLVSLKGLLRTYSGSARYPASSSATRKTHRQYRHSQRLRSSVSPVRSEPHPGQGRKGSGDMRDPRSRGRERDPVHGMKVVTGNHKVLYNLATSDRQKNHCIAPALASVPGPAAMGMRIRYGNTYI